MFFFKNYPSVISISSTTTTVLQYATIVLVLGYRPYFLGPGPVGSGRVAGITYPLFADGLRVLDGLAIQDPIQEIQDPLVIYYVEYSE